MHFQVTAPDDDPRVFKEVTDALSAAQTRLNDTMARAFVGPDGTSMPCSNVITNIQLQVGTPRSANDTKLQIATVVVSYAVNSVCMRQQINTALTAMKPVNKDGPMQLGTTGLPCVTLFGPISAHSTNGEWDVDVRDFVRIYYLDHLNKSKRSSQMRR